MSKTLTNVFHFIVGLILLLPFEPSGNASPLCADLFYKDAPASPKRELIKLYSENVPIKKYTESLLKIKAGDTISFDQETQFTVKSVLGNGDTTIIFDIGKNKALRVPIRVNAQQGDAETKPVQLLNDFLNSNLGLRAVGANVVKVYPEESRKGRFIVTEKVDVQFTLEDFLEKQLDQAAFLEDQLVLFATSFWAVKNLGDFSPRQIAWDGKKWILLDYGYSADYIESFRDKKTIFDSYTVEGFFGRNEEVVFANNDLLKRIRESIHKKRKKAERKEWTLRNEGASSDKEVGLLVNFPFSGTLKEGTELYVNRESTYHSYLFDHFNIQKTNSYPSVKIIIEELVDRKKSMSAYKVRTANNKRALLILKNKLSNHLEILDDEVLKKFNLKDLKLGSVLGSGLDYFLIEIK
ncbi:MAG: hypothetical protein ACXVCP_06625 [Bdellovibrio sp.]